MTHNLTSVIEPSRYLALSLVQIAGCIAINKKGRVVIQQGITPAPTWLKAFMMHIHRRKLPDEYVLGAMHCLAITAEDWFEKYQVEPDADWGGIVDEIVNEAAGRYSNINNHAIPTRRRWIMWRDCQHWRFIDETVRTQGADFVSFDDLLGEAMRNQLREIADLSLNFVEDLIADAESAAEQAEAEKAASQSTS